MTWDEDAMDSGGSGPGLGRKCKGSGDAMSRVLVPAGYSVARTMNAAKAELQQQVKKFAESLEGSTDVIVHLVGHGCVVDGVVHMIPRHGDHPGMHELSALRLPDRPASQNLPLPTKKFYSVVGLPDLCLKQMHSCRWTGFATQSLLVLGQRR
jgi:hypothetical protein